MKTATPQTAESFDLIAFARANGYRQRNVNDGAQLPPPCFRGSYPAVRMRISSGRTVQRGLEFLRGLDVA